MLYQFLIAISVISIYLQSIVGIDSTQQCPSTLGHRSSGLISLDSDHPSYQKRPFIEGNKIFMNNEIISMDDESNIISVTSPIFDQVTGKRIEIGKSYQMNNQQALNVLDSSKKAWKNGQGEWPQMKLIDRISVIEKIVIDLKSRRAEIINVLMWEIAKTFDDAAIEFDRTMAFIEATIKELRDMDASQDYNWKSIGGVLARIRRTAIGIMLCLGPFNYPFNETYATLIPALLTGNIVIMKIPTIGGLAHMLTMEIYARHLPKGTLNFLTGSGRVTVTPVMETGDIDALAFIGSSKVADTLIKVHPHPHRLKVFLQLEGKNLGIVLPDASLDVAVEQIVVGSTTYNGQRCTALKLMLVHESLIDDFLTKFKKAISSLNVGLPWESNIQITPLPEHDKPSYLQDLIADALEKGANLINKDCGGGQISGNLMVPAIVFPVNSNMRLWHEEQFGPVIPIATFSNIQEVYDIIYNTSYGQQASIFTSSSSVDASELLDIFSTAVGRININTQCGRSPDSVPFSGRRSSALGTMSIREALNAFSIETVVAGKDNMINSQIMKGFESSSKFLSAL